MYLSKKCDYFSLLFGMNIMVISNCWFSGKMKNLTIESYIFVH